MHQDTFVQFYEEKMPSIYFQLSNKKLSHAHQIQKKNHGGNLKSIKLHEDQGILNFNIDSYLQRVLIFRRANFRF